METTAEPPFDVLLRRYRLAAGLSQEALATRARLSVRAISALERGIRRAPYRDTVELLAAALDLSAEERTRLHEAVPRTRGPAQPRAPRATPTNLTAPSTSFTGREWEAATVVRLVGSSRLVTLTGTGGVGKTRLAAHVAAGLAHEHPDGVWQIELAPLTEPALVPQIVARTLGIKEESGRPLLETLPDALRSRRLLLLLDNCEHLRAAVGAVAEALMRACPQVRLLATSREAIGVIGETVWRVPSMSVPRSQFQVPSEAGGFLEPGTLNLELGKSDGVRLFVERATAAHSAFALTGANAVAVATICRRLDGIPLAIELAAARARVLTAEQIAARLDARFSLLTRGSVDAPARQQTLRAALDWSYDLLSGPERRLLERLSVFAGGCDLEAAEMVCAEDGPSAGALFELLQSLVEKSLVTLAYQGEAARYSLLETVRQFAEERLAAAEHAPIRRRLMDWAVDLAERAAPRLGGPEQAAWLSRLDTDQDNLRAVLRWTLDGDEADLGTHLAATLWFYWQTRGLAREGLTWLEQLLPGATRIAPARRAFALHSAGILASDLGRFEQARSLFQESFALRSELGDERSTASSLRHLGIIAHQQGDYRTARSYFEEALAIERRHGNERAIAGLIGNVGLAAEYMGDREAAGRAFAEATAIFQRLGDRIGLARGLNNLAINAAAQQRRTEARRYLDEAVAIHEGLGNQPSLATSLHTLALLEIEEGEFEEAGEHARRSFSIREAIGDERGMATALTALAESLIRDGAAGEARAPARQGLRLARVVGVPAVTLEALWIQGLLASAEGRCEEAACLLSGMEHLWAVLSLPLPPDRALRFESDIAELRERLEPAAFARASEEGRSLTIEQATERALGVLGNGESAPRRP